MKLIYREKKEFRCDMVCGIICSLIYAVCLLYIRFIDYFANILSNRFMFVSISMFAVIVIMFLNYSMCIGGIPNKSLYNKINDFQLTTNNKKEIKEQRDILLKTLESTKYSNKAKIIFVFVEIVTCIFVFVLFILDIKVTNLITGIVIDIETAIMATMFYHDIHYKFKIEKNLKL